uniref:Uncharacterized protein n=1 Tax=Setaria digitata TaxID=48799 RepID=A0A915PI66_9BILA
MADMELRAFEARLDTMMDQLSEESTELIIERPRYAHAVMVFANGDEPGELLTASRIKMLDPIYVPVGATTNGHQIFHHYSELGMITTVILLRREKFAKNFRDMKATSATESASGLNDCDERENFKLFTAEEVYVDDDIQKALRKLEESRNMLNEPIVPNSTNVLLSNDPNFDCANGNSKVRTKTPQEIHLSASSAYSRSISERYAALKDGAVLFPSQLRKERRTSVSASRKLL